MHGCGCETCGGACAWEPPDNTEDDMDTDKLANDLLDGFVKELAKRRVEAQDLHTQDAQDPREMFWVDAHNTLVAITYMLQEQKVLGIFNETTEALLTAAKWALDAEFSRGNRVVEEEDVAF